MLERGLVRFSRGGAVLGLHSLTTVDLPSSGIANLPLDLFASLIKAVRKAAAVVSLAELVDEHLRGRSTGGAVAVSFDDAYASLLVAAGLIRAERIPVTVFVTTNAAQTGAAYWWDRIDDLFPRVSPARWRAFEDEVGLPEAFRLGQPAEFGPLRPIRQWVLSEYKGRWAEVLESPLTRLEKETGARTAHRSMTFAELDEFARDPNVEFGVHTLSHPVLPLVDEAEFHDEVAGCHRLLSARLPRVHPILAIPFGLFDERTAGMARTAGMTTSLTLASRTFAGFSATDALPRFGLTCREPGWKLVLRVIGVVDRLRSASGSQYPPLPSPTT